MPQSNTAIRRRWRTKLAIRRALLAAARARLRAHTTDANHDKVVDRLHQVAAAERVLARHPGDAASVSPAGVRLIAEFEGCFLRPYRDPVGIWTIGYGHIEGVTADTPPLRSKAAARALLQRDLDKKYAPYVTALGLPLNQNQYDALVSFVYNVGPGGIASTTHVGKALRQAHWREAADHLLDWDKAGGQTLPGLTRRRRAERALFLRPVTA